MAKKSNNLNYDDYIGAIVVMENYLDGAVADYEDGQVENDSLIWSCIKTIKLIQGLSNPWLLLGGNEYEKRMNEAKERLKR